MKDNISSTLQESAKLKKKSGYHHGDLRASIMNAVAQLIGEKRGLNFQLKEVASLVGTSQPAIYKHFAGKDDLLVETAVEGYNLLKQFRDHAIKLTDGSILSIILAIGYSYVNFSCVHSGYFLLMKNLETEEMLSSGRYINQRREVTSLAFGLIQQCIDDKLFTDIDKEHALILLQSTAYGLAHLYITGQIKYIAGKYASNQRLTIEILVKSMNSLLSTKGKKELLKVQDKLFSSSSDKF